MPTIPKGHPVLRHVGPFPVFQHEGNTVMTARLKDGSEVLIAFKLLDEPKPTQREELLEIVRRQLERAIVDSVLDAHVNSLTMYVPGDDSPTQSSGA